MKKFNASQAVSTAANIGVILGIVFLAYEVNQNNELMRAEAEFNYLQTRIANRQRISWDPEYAEFVFRTRRDGAETGVDVLRMSNSIQANLLALQWEYGQLISGNLRDDPATIIEKWRSDFGLMFTSETSPFSRVWANFRSSLQPDFVEFWEQNVIEQSP